MHRASSWKQSPARGNWSQLLSGDMWWFFLHVCSFSSRQESGNPASLAPNGHPSPNSTGPLSEWAHNHQMTGPGVFSTHTYPESNCPGSAAYGWATGVRRFLWAAGIVGRKVVQERAHGGARNKRPHFVTHMKEGQSEISHYRLLMAEEATTGLILLTRSES